MPEPSAPPVLEAAQDQPPGTTTLLTGSPTWIALPASGELWVAYEPGSGPADYVNLWHQGGETTPIAKGAATYPSLAGDYLTFSAPAGTEMKLAWGYIG